MTMFYATFFVVRIAFLLLYSADFSELSSIDVLYALAKGALFFDTSIILVFLGIPFLITYLPWRWCASQWYLRCVSWFAFVTLCLFSLLLVADLLYFGIVHRHASHEVGAAFSSSGLSMVGTILSEYWVQLVGLSLAMMVVARVWHQWLAAHQKRVEHQSLGWWRIPVFMMMFLLILLGMRGGYTSKPIQSVFAYNEGTMSQGHLTLNGTFSILHGLDKSVMTVPDFMPHQEAMKVTQKMFSSSFESYPDKDYPLMRQRTTRLIEETSKPNVVIILLESWDSDSVDITRELAGKKPYNVTPNFNDLVKKGRLYTNFFANGQRSIDGISSIIAGIPTVPSAGYLGEGIETNTLGWLGTLAKEQGYYTAFLRSAGRASFYMDKVTPLAGFDDYFGAEDLPPTQHPQADEPKWGGWDHDLFLESHALFDSVKQPFLGVLFTVSMHTPWDVPSEKWEIFSGDTKKEKFLNATYYTDWALGKYFEGVVQSSYAENTIFILLGDHVSGHTKNPTIKDQHRVPMLVLGPGIEPGIDDTLSGQLDLIPTIMDWAGWNGRYASMGVSLLEERDERGVLFTRGDMLGRIESDAVVMHNMKRTVYFEGNEAKKDAIVHKLKAQVQVMMQSLDRNKVMK